MVRVPISLEPRVHEWQERALATSVSRAEGRPKQKGLDDDRDFRERHEIPHVKGRPPNVRYSFDATSAVALR